MVAWGDLVTGVIVDITTAELADLSSNPVELVAAPGAGRTIVPIFAVFEYIAGSAGFYGTGDYISILVSQDLLQTASDPPLPGTVSSQGVMTPSAAFFNDTTAGDDAPLMVAASDDPLIAGSILTASLDVAGTGYAPGDTGVIGPTSGGATSATYEVDTVGGGGEVVTFHITDPGIGYAAGRTEATAINSGAGDGLFTVNVDTITELTDGSGRVTVLYYIAEVA